MMNMRLLPIEDNGWVGATDFWGDERIDSQTVDLGAFELPDLRFFSDFDDN